MRVNGRRLTRVLLVIAFVIGTISPAFQAQTVSATQITQRSLTLQAGDSVASYDADTDGVIDGASQAGGIVDHTFQFTVETTAQVGSIKFLYCNEPSASDGTGPCTTPTGLDTTSATIGTQTGADGFSMNNATQGAPYLTRPAAEIAVDTIVNLQLRQITNPTTVNETFYVRIFTYATTDATGLPTDTGAVTASTAEQITLTGTMPESLIFCTGENIDVNGGGIPDCSTATPGDISFDQLFSPQDTATAISEMAASTNAGSGYAITVNGPTLTSGSNTVPALTAATTSTTGVGQFGMNLVANTTLRADNVTTLGANVIPVSDPATDHHGRAFPGYDTADNYKYVSGEVVADSAAEDTVNGQPTNAQIYTASYIVNVSGAQPAGTYTTTLTYVCTATF